jgi:hypothetical protein
MSEMKTDRPVATRRVREREVGGEARQCSSTPRHSSADEALEFALDVELTAKRW